MAAGCRDCASCTRSGLGKLLQAAGVGLVYVCTAGIGYGYVLKRALRRHCPLCGHLLARHARRADGSFRD
ncbi:hypothetical protein IHE61_18210 [Streptomyces sp. GKU 257-1]|nr:hypothetical protein [Streptomyces sp. GKU 257-1]